MAEEQTNGKRILIIKLSSIGDVVMATPVAKALRKALPDAYIAWVVEDKSKDVVIGNPYLDEVIVWNRRTATGNILKKIIGVLVGIVRLGPELRSRKFDIAIDLQGLLRSALVARASGARCRLGYDNAREGAGLFYNLRFPARQRRVRGPQQYLSMLESLDIHSEDLDMYVPIREEDRAFARDFVSKHGQNGRRVIALCPATTWPQKHWTEEGWARFADAIASEHGAIPVFLGSRADVELIERICSHMRCKAVNAAGKTTLKQAAAILELSDVVVAVDTGLLHISLALNLRTIGIFGPTKWKHLHRKDNFVVVANDFACMPCMRHPVCQHFDCMRAITAEDVLSACRAWLNGKQSYSRKEMEDAAEYLADDHETASDSKPLRTLHVETGMHSLGGPAQVVYLVKGLQDRGHFATLVCPDGSSVVQHATAAGLSVITVPLRTDLDLRFVLRLYRIIRHVNPDIVHLHSRRGADIMGGIAGRLASSPAVILSRRIDNPVRRGLLSHLKYGPLCDRIIAISNGVLDALVKGGVNPDKITCVRSVVEAKHYQKSGCEEKIRAEFGLDEHTNVVAVLAQLIERKGHRFLFQAAPKILEAFPNTAFLVLGEGQLEAQLREFASRLKIEDKVIFGGFRNNIGEILSIVTVLAHTPTMEGMGVSILQAMAAGIPVVATHVGGIPEAVQDGVNGILVPPKSVDAIADAIIRLLGSSELRDSMGAAGQGIVKEQFSVDGMVEGVLSVYREALNHDRAAVHATR